MKRSFQAATLAASAALLFLGTAPAQAAPDKCRSACSKTFATCQKTAKAEGPCLQSWGACKNKCKKPVAATAAKPKPAMTTTKTSTQTTSR